MQPVETVILIRWNLEGVPRVPWEANGKFQGTSRYKLDKSGKIYEHKVDNFAFIPLTPVSVDSVFNLVFAVPSGLNPTFFSADCHPWPCIKLYQAIRATVVDGEKLFDEFVAGNFLDPAGFYSLSWIKLYQAIRAKVDDGDNLKEHLQGTSMYKLGRHGDLLVQPLSLKPEAASVVDLVAGFPVVFDPAFLWNSSDCYSSSWIKLYQAVRATLDDAENMIPSRDCVAACT